MQRTNATFYYLEKVSQHSTIFAITTNIFAGEILIINFIS